MTPSQKKHLRGLLKQEMITWDEYKQCLNNKAWTIGGMIVFSTKGDGSRGGPRASLYKGRAIDVLKAKLLGTS